MPDVTHLSPQQQRIFTLLQRADKLIDALMPGIRHIAVQNYKEVNDVPCDIAGMLKELSDPATTDRIYAVTRRAESQKHKIIDITGQRFGRLVVKGVSETKRPGNTSTHWACLCDCGNTSLQTGWRLRHGKVLSCGCLRNATAGERLRRARARSKT